ncbi:MAG: hypothetical protein GY828_06790 [Candidatus Gracilibacteria bacterium]|nr:hypothetical protein [Candidatus Gracilibacteria bacterium]
MKRFFLGVISIFFIFSLGTTYAQTGDILEEKSIKEIKENIEKLSSDKIEITDEYKILKNKNQMISFFKTDISRDDFNTLKSIITTYNDQFTYTEKQLLGKAKNLEDISYEKNKLLQIKKNFYQSLMPYIKPGSYEEYLQYIRGEVSFIKKEKHVDGELIANKEILLSKVNKIEEKIYEQRRIMSESLKIAVSKKIDEKLNRIKSNEKFVQLSPELQAKVIYKTIMNVEKILDQMILEADDSSILSQKIEVYEFLLKKLYSYHDSLLQKEEGN